jgi:glycosyltransferase involved in cell wall biosynthesis
VPTRDPTPSTAPIDLVTVCRLVPWKNVDALIRYTAETQAVRLTVVGDGPQRRDLEALADELNSRPSVLFRGGIDRNATLAAIGHADIFVLNSDYEGLPHVVLEAMALARPVVARTSGGSREVLQHDVTGLLIDDDAGLWAALRRLREEPALSARLVSAAQQVYTDHFTERAMCERTVAYLEDCYRRPAR